MTAETATFKKGMRNLAGGVTLITTCCEGARGGLTATAVCSVSAAPPQLLVCVNKTASAHDPIGKSAIFAVNVLSTRHIALAMRFSGQDGVEGDARFSDKGAWRTLKTGAPVLADALASFDCELVKKVDVGTHTIYIGHIVDVAVCDGSPLIYSDGLFVTPQAIAAAG
ncbi:MAG: flavin reductase family protein [Reyranellaceae bacterium]